MKKRIHDIIKEELVKKQLFDEENINKILQYLGQEKIKNSELISSYYKRKIEEKQIVYVKDFFKLTIEEAKKILGCGETVAYNYVISVIKKISLVIIKQRIIAESKTKAKIIHKKITELLEQIEKNEELIEILKEEIIYKEIYNSLDQVEQKRIKNYKYARLQLNKNELKILKKYIFDKFDINYLNDTKDDNTYNEIINIYNELINYFIKLEYKKIINNKHKEIEELDLSNKALNALKRCNIFYIKDLIELSEEELKEIPSLGVKAIQEIITKLEQENILLSDKKEEIINTIKIENTHIIRRTKK